MILCIKHNKWIHGCSEQYTYNLGICKTKLKFAGGCTTWYCLLSFLAEIWCGKPTKSNIRKIFAVSTSQIQ